MRYPRNQWIFFYGLLIAIAIGCVMFALFVIVVGILGGIGYP